MSHTYHTYVDHTIHSCPRNNAPYNCSSINYIYCTYVFKNELLREFKQNTS